MLQPGEVTSQPRECDLEGPVVYLLHRHSSGSLQDGAFTVSKVTGARSNRWLIVCCVLSGNNSESSWAGVHPYN